MWHHFTVFLSLIIITLFVNLLICNVLYKEGCGSAQARSHGVANSTPLGAGCQLFPPLGIFLQYFVIVFFFEVKEKSPEILAYLNLGPCDILECSIFTCRHIIHLTLITKYQASSQNL